MEQEKETITLTWRGIELSASITRNWLNVCHHHIELRADCPLPVTKTGYRSEFVPCDAFDEQFDGLEDYVLQWLDDADKRTNWFNKNRQMSLDL